MEVKQLGFELGSMLDANIVARNVIYFNIMPALHSFLKNI